ncbi:MAG: Aldehyde/histidinol dehydrogenase [Olpidium bornovanus]|uniref:Aldehyde/histidinol dehydrogenase n=1 Tax=Olpidium bornovanus TaxID=278681 RepID=A0A8H7ZU28_9FUNG|nr:MAG: Aldehyde/histidinol dehydrogenase [Olpidium bornovanus]
MLGFRIISTQQRHQILKSWYSLITASEGDLAVLITLENGKPLKESLSEVRYGASFIEWFAEEARRVYGDVIPNPVPDQRLLVLKQPVGVVAIITPWNFPFAVRRVVNLLLLVYGSGPRIGCCLGHAGPNPTVAFGVFFWRALAAGCTTIVKPASETPLSALALAELGMRAGVPQGVLNVVTTSHKHTKEVGEELTKHADIRKVSFTGSVRANFLDCDIQGSSCAKT